MARGIPAKMAGYQGSVSLTHTEYRGYTLMPKWQTARMAGLRACERVCPQARRRRRVTIARACVQARVCTPHRPLARVCTVRGNMTPLSKFPSKSRLPCRTWSSKTGVSWSCSIPCTGDSILLNTNLTNRETHVPPQPPNKPDALKRPFPRSNPFHSD
jgi:hypothetical protein